MKKNIDIPEEGNVLENLQILAVKKKMNFKHYLESVLIKHSKTLKDEI